MKKSGCLFLFLFSIFVSTQGQEFKSSIAQSEILLGQPDTFYLQLRTKQTNPPFPSINDTLSKHIEVLGKSKIDTLLEETGYLFTQSIYITSFDTGYFVIPPFQVKLKDSLLETLPILLKVHAGDFSLEKEIKDIKNIEDAPWTFKEIAVLIGKILLILLLIALLFFAVRYVYLHYIKKDKTELEQVPLVLFSEEFWKEFEKIKNSQLWKEGRVKEYHSQVSNLLRMYLKHRFELEALERTTSEINILLMSSSLEQTTREKVLEVLHFADMVKFAKAQGIQDQHEKALENLKLLAQQYGFKDELRKSVE